MQQQTNRNADHTRRRILDAALESGREVGFAGTSIRGICKRAEISVGAFYHYFESKDDLLNEAFFHYDSTLTEEVLARYDALPALDAIKEVLLDQTRFTANEGFHLMTEYYRALLQTKNRAAVSPDRLYYRTVGKYVEKARRQELLTATQTADEMTELLVRFVRGNLIDWCLHDGGYDVVAQTAKELDLLLASRYFTKK